jgi:hypothetical protein
MLSKRQKTEEVSQSPKRGGGADGTPNKSLNASFSKLNAF